MSDVNPVRERALELALEHHYREGCEVGLVLKTAADFLGFLTADE